jgi:hypothetical protein
MPGKAIVEIIFIDDFAAYSVGDEDGGHGDDDGINGHD